MRVSRCAAWRAGRMGALLAAGLFLAPAGPQAQPYDQDRHGDLKGYLRARTVFIKMSCTPEVVDADAGLDRGLITIEPRISWGSGVLIRNDGYLVTVYHTLKELLQREDRTTTGGQRYTLACDDDDVEIVFYRTDNLASAATGGPVSYPEIPSSRDTSLGERRDVLFLQANTFGDDLPHVCSYGSYQNDTAFAGRAITAAGIPIQAGGSFSWRAREGQGSSERGMGEGSNFLLMTVPVETGMSGGPVVDERGELVGIVHGYRPSASPAATDNLLIPFYLFDDTFRDFAATCPPPTMLVNLLNPPDGSIFDHFPRELELSWAQAPGSTKYVVQLQVQDPNGGNWHPHPNQSRFVSNNTSINIEFIGAQPGRWKVTAFNAKEKAIAESQWWYFHFER